MEWYTQVEMTDFWFTTVIRTGQYISLDIISFIICFIKWDKGTLFLPEAGHTFIVVVLCIAFCLPVHNSPKSYHNIYYKLLVMPRQKYELYLSTAESHLKRNALLLQLSFYEKRFKSISQK